MNKILVTGGAGFIGSNFVLQWLAHETAEVVVIDKLTYAGNAENLKHADDARLSLVIADIGDRDIVRGVLKDHQPSVVINFAAESHVDRSIHGSADFIQTNIVSTYHFLEELRSYWDHLDGQSRSLFRFLHVSTDEVYGSLAENDSAFNEASAYAPNSPYAASKAASDHLVRAWHHTYGLPVLTTNCSNNYGPFHFPEKLIPLVILNALDNKPIPIYGDGQQIRDWLYVEDHCEALRCVLKKGVIGETYNIGSGNEKKNIDVALAICDLLDELSPRKDGKNYHHQITFVKDRMGHDRRYAIDASRIRRDLGWSPVESFETGLRKTVLWYLSHKDWVANIKTAAYTEWLSKNYEERC